MAKATLSLANGTTVLIEGTPAEVRELLEFYSGESPPASRKPARGSPKKTGRKAVDEGDSKDSEGVDHSAIVNLIKSCDEAEEIESRILDQTSVVDRTLLPLYVVHEQMDNSIGLTSGDVNKITTQLGFPIATPNASAALSKTASGYVIGHKMRTRGGIPVNYKLSRRGVRHMKSVISGESSSEKSKRPKKAGKRASTEKKAAKKPTRKKHVAKEAAGKSKGAKKTPRAGRPGPGAMLTSLAESGFFATRQTIVNIQKHCETKLAHNYPLNELSTPLRRAVHKGLLKRKENDEGQYEYSVQ